MITTRTQTSFIAEDRMTANDQLHSTRFRTGIRSAAVCMALVLGLSAFQQPSGQTATSPASDPCRVLTSTPAAPFQVRLDGRALGTEPGESAVVLEQCRDRVLREAGIQVRVDERERTPTLNVSGPSVLVRGASAGFQGYSNYPAWIERSEIRILGRDDRALAVVGLSDGPNGHARWEALVPSDIQSVRYVLRVYDAEGRFDETAPREIVFVDRLRADAEVARADDDRSREFLSSYGVNRRSIANIPVRGRAVTVNAEDLDPDTRVMVGGRTIPVGENGRMATRELLPPGEHEIRIVVDDPSGRREFLRLVNVPTGDWFYLGVADLTAGKNSVDGPASLVTGRSSRRYDGDSFVDGRLAFYLKGQLGRETVLTASADTRERPVSELFSNLTRQDPDALLRRLDANVGYPIYGDDGTLVEDAPTNGKFHVRVEHRDSHLMWGSFLTPVAGTELVRFQRGLQGLELRHRAGTQTRFGERRTRADLFAAEPGSVGAWQEFRATGGSLYYLRNQDVLWGSERVTVEVRDRESGLVVESRTLIPTEDYEVNYLQGRILLRQPLSSVAGGGGLVRTSAVNGDPVHLVVSYEHSPTSTGLDDLSAGGRVSHWLGDHAEVGVTGYRQRGDLADHDLYGADFTWRPLQGTWFTLEGARSEGLPSLAYGSSDGGLSFAPLPLPASESSEAEAYRAEGVVQLADLTEDRVPGRITGYWQRRDAGFASPGNFASEGLRQGGIEARVSAHERLGFRGRGDIREGTLSGSTRSFEVGGELGLTSVLQLEAGVRQERRERATAGGASALLSEVGARTDMIGVLGYQPVDSLGEPRAFRVYGLVQGTLQADEDRSSNDRYGIGGNLRLTDRIQLTSELTDGSRGWGGVLETDVQLTDRTNVYLNYLLDPDRLDTAARGRTGNLSAGSRVRYSEQTNIFVEHRQQTSALGQAGFVNVFGLDLAPSDRWSWGLQLEGGVLSDPMLGDVDRRAVSVNAGFAGMALKWGGGVEYRLDKGDEGRRQTTWLLRNTASLELGSGWRGLARANVARVRNGLEDTALPGAEYTEFIAGLAYRPVAHDRTNVLFRYTRLFDESPPNQLGPAMARNTLAQRSHVLSVDGIRQLTSRISAGGKIGYRSGEIRDRLVPDAPWVGSQALLLIGRSDIRLVQDVDLVGEYRWLSAREASDERAGVLLGIYRQLGSNLRMGVGYNFTDYSDDLTDLGFRSRGVFLNILGVL